MGQLGKLSLLITVFAAAATTGCTIIRPVDLSSDLVATAGNATVVFSASKNTSLSSLCP